ncbi:protein SIP5-like [Panicum miliaceum]|uniref:Protein SIP5-like n=1 Tax=Panicum miliaceum TaxID=4540 RepID=A0A3L6RWU5_PANMI|nr:protein SIP5-like [Panicum miliaceum]
MGNVVVSGVQIRRRLLPTVEERLTRPRRLVRELPDLDAGRLHCLIRSGDLAPCFDAAEDASDGRAEECPICFYFYPSLNRSKCCCKGICTECFLQLMPSKASKAVHCPFCKTKSYAIEYRGAQTTSEKKTKQEGEQNVNESKLRVHSKSQIAGKIVLP